jgi:RHS repeat-associated protein
MQGARAVIVLAGLGDGGRSRPRWLRAFVAIALLASAFLLPSPAADARVEPGGARPHVVRHLATTQGGTIQFGAATQFDITTAGDVAYMTFAGTAGMRIAWLATASTFSGSWAIRILDPNNVLIANCSNACYSEAALSLDGTYTVQIVASSTGHATVTLWNPVDVNSTTTPDSGSGATTTVTVNTPGQRQNISFTGSVGQRIAFAKSNLGGGDADAFFRDPYGVTLRALGGRDGWADPITLTTPGTYTLVLDPQNAGTGSWSVTLYDVPPDATYTTTPLSGSGATTAVRITTPGQKGRVTFTGSVGQRIAFAKSGIDFTEVDLQNPAGSTIASCGGINCGWSDPVALTQAGTYTLYVDSGTRTGTETVTAYDVPPDPAYPVTPTATGATASVVIDTPGENASVTFSGSGGQRVSWTKSDGSIGFIDSHLFDPNGVSLALCGPINCGFAGPVTLSQPGLYKLALDPGGGRSGSMSATVYDVPADPTSSLPLGGSTTMTIATPGQVASASFQGYAGEPITIVPTMTLDAPLWNVHVFDPNGAQLSAYADGTAGGPKSIVTTLPLDGTYRLQFNPQPGSGSTGTVSATYNLQSAFEPLPQTYGPCDGGLDALNQSGCWDDVNTLLGAYTTQATDASMPAIGIPFNYTRSYASANTSTSRLGPGWTDSYSAAISVQANGDALVQDENGQQLYFPKRADGSFLQPPGGVATLNTVSGAYQLLNNDQTKLRFDNSGRLLSIKDRNSEGVSLAYDASGNLQTVTDSVGRVVTFTPNPDGTVQKLTLPDGRVISYGYTAGRLTSATLPDPDGAGLLSAPVWMYGYDTSGLLASVQNPNLHTIVSNHYTNGRIDTQTDALGKQTLFAWDAATQTETVTDANGHARKDVYQNNMLVKTIDPLGDTTVYGYDANNNLASVKDPRLNTATMTYDAGHNLLTRTAPAPLSYTEAWTYNSFNDPLSYIDGRGNGSSSTTCPASHTTCYGYDSAGNLTSKTLPDPDGAGPMHAPVIGYDRDPTGTGLVVSQTNPNNHTTSYGYDGQGNLTSITSPAPLSEKTTMGYDSVGRLTSRVDPRGNIAGCGCAASHATTFAYDGEDHLTSEIDPGLPAKSWAYDAAGNLKKVTDQIGHFTSYGYDADERLSSVTAPDQTSVTGYDYDNVGNLAHRTDPNTPINHVTSYGYDNANRLTTITLPTITTPTTFTPIWTYGYDANGNQTSILDPNGATTTSRYDELNRLTSIDYSDSTADVTYSYDPDSNRTQMVDGDGTVTYSYDNDNRLTSSSRVHTAGGTDTFNYGYDSAGNITSRTYPDSTVVTYTPDTDERLATASVGGTTISYGYDPASNLTSTSTPDSYTETRGYDNANRLTSILTRAGNTTLATFTYTLDNVGNPTAVTGTNPAIYTYDSRDRLTSVCFQTSTCTKRQDPYISWTYDPVGNRKTETRGVNGTTTNYTYNQDDQLLGAGSTSYAYDHNGNQTQAGSRSFTYDAANRLATTISGSTTYTYTYDGDDNRLTDTVGSTVTKYLWDTNNPLPQLALERDSANNPLRSYTIGNDTIGYTTPAGSFYYHYDGLGSVVNVTNATGVKQWTYNYDPYGSARTTTQNATGAPTNPLRYTGEYLDTTGLYNLRARQYDPATGRFLETDPAPAGPRAPYSADYVYGDDDPTVTVDPSGETAINPVHPGLLVGLSLLAWGSSCLTNPSCSSSNSIIIKKLVDIYWQARGTSDTPNLEKARRGPGSVPKDQRDPKRTLKGKKDRQEVADSQDGRCAGCEEPLGPGWHAHHHRERWADGGKTRKDNTLGLCPVCHRWVHSP